MGFSVPAVLPRTAVGSYPAFSPLPVLADLGGYFLCHFPSPHGARPLAGILLCGARTFLHAHKAHSGCLADFQGHYISATLFIFNALQNIFRPTLICRRAQPKICVERNAAFLAGAISNLRFHCRPRFGGASFFAQTCSSAIAPTAQPTTATPTAVHCIHTRRDRSVMAASEMATCKAVIACAQR